MFILDLCKPIGVQKVSQIPDNSITATSYFSSSFYPHYGRLNETRGMGWCPKTTHDRNDYLQVDLGRQHTLCAVATQGRASGGAAEWTTSYKLSGSTDGVNWSFYQENNKDKVLEWL